MNICLHKGYFYYWETIKASFRILPDHFRGLAKKVFFQDFAFCSWCSNLE